jgi:hypothetical protein
MGKLCTGGSSEIGPNGRVSDDREWYSTIRGRDEESQIPRGAYSLEQL